MADSTDTKVVMSVSLVDKWGVRAVYTGYAKVAAAQAITAVTAQWQSLVSALDGITDAQILKGHINLVPTLPGGIKTGPVTTGAPVEQTGLFGFSVLGNTNIFGQDVPAISNSVISAGKIVLGTGAVASFTNLLLATVGSGGNTVFEYAGFTNQALVALQAASVPFRKHRRGQRGQSKEA
jgi:hypothetical protein